MKKLLWILPGLCLWADDTALLSVLRQHCAGCHSGPSPQAGLSVENIEALRKGGKRGPALLPGHASQSSLVDYLKGLKTPRMPLGAPPRARRALGGRPTPLAGAAGLGTGVDSEAAKDPGWGLGRGGCHW